MDPYQRAVSEARPAWYTDPRPGDTIEASGGRSREVIGRPLGRVEYRDHYGRVASVTLKSWQSWANMNRANIRHYGS